MLVTPLTCEKKRELLKLRTCLLLQGLCLFTRLYEENCKVTISVSVMTRKHHLVLILYLSSYMNVWNRSHSMFPTKRTSNFIS